MKNMLEKIIDNNNIEHMRELSKYFCQLAEHVKSCDPVFYKEIHNNLYILANGEHLNEAMAKEWVDKMHFEAGTCISKEQTDSLAKQNGIVFANMNFNEWDWYAIINKMHSELYDYVEKNEDYIDLALDFFRDALSCEGKAYRYFHYLVK